MMEQEAIPVKLPVTRIGQRIYFQVALPEDAKNIIGLEYGTIIDNGVLLVDPLPVGTAFSMVANKVIGKLTLGVAGCENLFYQGDLTENRNIAFGENSAAVLWQPRLWTHGRKREEIGFNVNGDTTLVEGFFLDSWGVDEYESLEYQLHLYLWIEKHTT